jgi:cytoskeletal protein RodZ
VTFLKESVLVSKNYLFTSKILLILKKHFLIFALLLMIGIVFTDCRRPKTSSKTTEENYEEDDYQDQDSFDLEEMTTEDTVDMKEMMQEEEEEEEEESNPEKSDDDMR